MAPCDTALAPTGALSWVWHFFLPDVAQLAPQQTIRDQRPPRCILDRNKEPAGWEGGEESENGILERESPAGPRSLGLHQKEGRVPTAFKAWPAAGQGEQGPEVEDGAWQGAPVPPALGAPSGLEACPRRSRNLSGLRRAQGWRERSKARPWKWPYGFWCQGAGLSQ